MKTSLAWCRLWADAVDDDKLRLLGFCDRWHFIAMLCLKAQGVLDERDEGLRRQRIGIKLGLDSVELETAMKRLVTVGLLNDAWHPKNWNRRQYKSDSSTSRVRALRKRYGNVSETDQSQRQSRADTEQKKNPLTPLGLDEPAFRKFQDYRKQIGKPIKPPSIDAAMKALSKFGVDQMAVVDQSIANGWQGLFALKAEHKPPVRLRTADEIEAEERSRAQH